jgi:thioredoxin 1
MSEFLGPGCAVRESDASPRAGAPAGRLFRAALLGPAACLLLAMLAGGCESGNVTELSDPDHFRREVLESDVPVLVDFYKGGCPICWPLDPVLVQLAKEYEGRAKIAKFMIMMPWWTFPYWDFKQQYQIYFVPEVLLFHKGVEVKRWPMMYLIDPYRAELDKLVPPPGGGPAPSATAPPRLTAPPPAATTRPGATTRPAPARTPAGDRVP